MTVQLPAITVLLLVYFSVKSLAKMLTLGLVLLSWLSALIKIYTLLNYHVKYIQSEFMLFYGGDFSLNTSSKVGIFVDYPRDMDGGSDGVNIFGSPNYPNRILSLETQYSIHIVSLWWLWYIH